MGEFTEKQAVPGGPDATMVREFARPLFEVKGWMKFLGVIMIIVGVIQACTVVGLIIAWLPIWLGILLFSTGSKIDAAFQSGNKADLMTGLGKLKTFFTIYGIMAIIGIAMSVIGLILAGGTIFALLAGGGLEALTGTAM